MRFVCESCRAQYMINDEKVGPKGVKVRCRKCGYVILVKKDAAKPGGGPVAQSNDPDDALATQVMQSPSAGADSTLSSDMTNPGEEPEESGAPTVGELPAAEEPKAEARAEAKPEPKVEAKPEPRPEPKKPEPKAEKKPAKAADSLLGADEDEIGAVFDQVLSGAGQANKAASDALGGEDDRQSTRVIDANVVKKLAEESVENEKKPEVKAEDVPTTDWYVAINEKQTGPLTLEQVKGHWDAGEIGPDSLCWRGGMGDWIPLSDVKALASVLAPKPPKPIVVAPGATFTGSQPALVSVPVQSAFSSGGMLQSVQSQVQVPMAAAGASLEPESTGTWRPSAASALASLVKDEMDALAKPPPAKKPEPAHDEPASVRGLLDLPEKEERPAPAASASAIASLPDAEVSVSKPAPAPRHHEQPREERPAQRAAPVNPYMANPGATFSSPPVTSYRPQSNRGLIIGIAAGGGAVVLLLLGVVIWLATRQPQVVVQPQQPQVAVVGQPPVQPVAVQQPVQPPPTQPVAVQPPPTQPVAVQQPPTQPQPGQPVAAQPPTQPVAVQPQPTQPTQPPTQPVVAPPLPTGKGGTGTTAPKGTHVAKADPPAPTPKEEKKVEKAPAGGGGEDDDFAAAFGGGKTAKKAEKKEDPAPEATSKKSGGYMPPPPGGGDVKDSLGPSDVMEVVLSNKGALAKCADEQHKREPGVSGKLVMKWSIQTSGRTSNVSVVTDEYKGTYMAGCVGGIIKSMSFPRHKTAGEPVQFPFKF